FGMAVEQFANFQQQEAHMVGLALWAQAESRLKQDLVASAQVLQIDCRNGAIRDGEQCSLLRSDASRAQADIFNHSGAIPEAARITNRKDLTAKHQISAEKILDLLLWAEADRQSADAQPGERGAHVE